MQEIDDLQMDALRELGNVGASHASTALSELVKKDILIDITECKILPMSSIPPRLGDEGDVVATVRIQIDGTSSYILMVFPEHIATYLSDLLMGRKLTPGRKMTEEDKEVLVEMGDICIRQYLNPISKFLGIDIVPSSPIVSVDRLESRVKFPEVLSRLQVKGPARIETNFVDREKRFQGAIFYFPDRYIQDLTFKRFGVDRETQMATFARFGLKG